MRPRRCVLGLVAGLLLAPHAGAQLPPPLDLPAERRPEAPAPSEAPTPAPVEPMVPAPDALPETSLPELRVLVRAIRVRGNTVLDPALLEGAIAEYAGRELSTREIETLRERLTMLYVERGYLTSGAIVPDQDFESGELQVVIVEGRIAELEIEGARWFRESYLRGRILPEPDAPLDVPRLEQRLQLVQADPQIRALHAELRPGLRLGESVLRVRIEERAPYALSLETSNDRSPAIGAWNGGLQAGLRNPTGWGDRLRLRAELGESLRDVGASYEIGSARRGTQLHLRFRWSESEIVEEPFDALDVSSDFISAGFELSQPLIETLGDRLRVGLLAEWRRGRNFVNGAGFSFSPGADRGVSTASVLRPFVEWVHRGRERVIALRGQVSVGIPILEHTDVRGTREDATFAAGLLQAQLAQRFSDAWGIELVLRADLQLADQPLLPIEKFSIGGPSTVRGYRQSQVVRDSGANASLELRIPILRQPDGSPILQLAPFGDFGSAWDHADREDAQSDTLGSVGLGLRLFPFSWLQGELYWGQRIEHVDNPHEALQDYGVHARLTASVF